MKIRVDEDLWYPVWGPDPTGRYEAEVTQEFLNRYNAALKTFKAVLDELQSLVLDSGS